MFGGFILTIVGIISTLVWAREIAKGYRAYRFVKPSTLAYLRREGAAMFGLCVGLCGLCLATSVLIAVWGAMGHLPIR